MDILEKFKDKLEKRIIINSYRRGRLEPYSEEEAKKALDNFNKIFIQLRKFNIDLLSEEDRFKLLEEKLNSLPDKKDGY